MTVAMDLKVSDIITPVNWKLVKYLAFVLSVISNKLNVQSTRWNTVLYLMKKNIKFLIRSSQEFCLERTFLSKSYISKYSGIPLNCPRCRKDHLHYESYHIK